MNLIQKVKQLECPVCFNEELSSPQLVYTFCCFQKICNVCDQILKNCVHCRAQLGELRIRFGRNSFDVKNSSFLRLLPGDHTVKSVIQTVKQFFPLVETQLANRLIMRLLNSRERWTYYYYEGEITNKNQYFLEYMRLPHNDLTNSEIESWIVTLLTSGKSLTEKPLTKEEIHKKCNSYATRISSSVLSQEQINVRIKDLMERGYCEFDEKTNVYKYLA